MTGKWILMLFLYSSTPPAVYFEDQASCINAGTEVMLLIKRKASSFAANQSEFLCLPASSKQQPRI